MKNTIKALTLVLLVILLPLLSNSQLIQNRLIQTPYDSTIPINQQVLFRLDTLGWFFRVPIEMFQIGAAKTHAWDDYITCRQQLEGITRQWNTAIWKVDSIDGIKNKLILNNEFLNNEHKTDILQLEICDQKTKTLKTQKVVLEGTIGVLVVVIVKFVILK